MSDFISSNSGSLGTDLYRWLGLYIGNSGINFTELGRVNTINNLNYSFAPSRIGTSNIIHISKRNDGWDGVGSPTDPRNGSTADLLDDIMRGPFISGMTGIQYIFDTGVYEFYGVGDIRPEETFGTYGFALNHNNYIIGKGRNLTQLKLVNKNPVGSGVRPSGGICLWNNVQGVKLANFTLDCNSFLIDGVGSGNSRNIYGIKGYVTGGVHIDNVSVKNYFGGNGSGIPGIGLYTSGANTTRNFINNCEIIQGIGNSACGIILNGNNASFPSGGFTGYGAIQATVQDCYIQHASGGGLISQGISFEGLHNSIIKNNYIRDFRYGIFNQTSYQADSIIAENQILNAYYCICIGNGRFTNRINGFNIHTNILQVASGGTGLNLNGGISNLSFINNQVKLYSGGHNKSSCYGISSLNTENLLLRNNMIASGFHIIVPTPVLYTGVY